jgi:type III restriction enzyme
MPLMSDFVRNPIINRPYDPPAHYWELDLHGQPTGVALEGRRPHRYVVPVAASRKRPQQGTLPMEDEETLDNTLVTSIRPQVDAWRRLPPSQWGLTPETERLLRWWRDRTVRELPFFFCQIEAVETIIWLTEVAPKSFRDQIAAVNDANNPGLFRVASKMATGSGKTIVMAMLIAWQAINAARHPRSDKYSNGFLIVTPGITIKDRLRVLDPSEPTNYFSDTQRRVVPPEMMGDLQKARVVVTNFHTFQLRDTVPLPATSRLILGERGEEKRFPETEGGMLQRVAPALAGMRRIIVINDEAHHCYRRKQGESEEADLKADERVEAKSFEEDTRIWVSGLEIFAKKIGVVVVYDLSATPFFLRGSGWPEGTLFPWVVSDFSLMDAIECGIVKTPRLPVLDDAVIGDMPKYRDLYNSLPKSSLPQKGRRSSEKELDPELLPDLLRGGLEALYRHYEKTVAIWDDAKIGKPAVFIVVANNTASSKLIYEFIAGYGKTEGEPARRRIVPGKLAQFSNVDSYGRWLDRPRTILIDSSALEAGDSLPDDFRRAAAHEIEEFRKEVARREGSAAAEKLSDAQILREVMNTVGQPGRLGAEIRCVVSVSMLTEGWDANTVTHILGVRAFGTQLLCEQVVGRGLRRVNYQPGEDGKLRPEYSDVLGVPFEFTQSPTVAVITPPPKTTRIFALSERKEREIRFPNVAGYRVAYPPGPLVAHFTDDSKLTVDPDKIPTRTDVEPIVGERITLTLENYTQQRMKSVYFAVAGYTLRRYFREDSHPKEVNPGAEPEETPREQIPLYRFGELLKITERWFDECLTCYGANKEHLRRLFLWRPLAQQAAERIARACAPADPSAEIVRAILNPYNEEGSSRHIDFQTSKEKLFQPSPQFCQLNYVVNDSGWEQAIAAAIEMQLGEPTIAYIRNDKMYFEVPYEYRGETHMYRPDFIVKLDDGRGADDPLYVVLEVKGFRDEQDAAKADTMRRRWLPGVNAARRFGRWAFVEVRNPYKLVDEIVPLLSGGQPVRAA